MSWEYMDWIEMAYKSNQRRDQWNFDFQKYPQFLD
jgi:hypothetical protein